VKTALITGITGQDGSYLAELLLEKGYSVHGIKRRASSFNTSRIDHLYQDPHEMDPRLVLHHGDLTDSTNLIRIIQQVQPDEIYNLGAQSHVAVSFEAPEYTANSDALGTLRLLEAVRILGLTETTRIYQASTSELYGLVQEIPQVEMQWRMLQQDTPEDFVIATGRQVSVRHFIELTAEELGWGAIKWEGEGLQELGRRSTGEVVVRIDPRYFRPAEVDTLLGDPSKAHAKLGWTPTTTLEELVEEMVTHDKEEARKEAILRLKGFQVVGSRE